MQPSDLAPSDPRNVYYRAWDEFNVATQDRRTAHRVALALLADRYRRDCDAAEARYLQSIEPDRLRREARIQEGAQQ